MAHRATMGGTEYLWRGLRPVDKVSVCYGGGQPYALGALTKITALVEAWDCSRTGTWSMTSNMQGDAEFRISFRAGRIGAPSAKPTLSVGT